MRRVRDSATRLVQLVDAVDFGDGDDHFQTSSRDDRSTSTQEQDVRIPDVDKMTTDSAPAEKRRGRNRSKNGQTTIGQHRSAGPR